MIFNLRYNEDMGSVGNPRKSGLFRFIIPSLVVAGIILTTMSFLGRWWWGFELVTHFRVQYLIFFSVLLVILILTRRWTLAAVSGGCLVVHLAAILPVFLGTAGPSEKDSKVVKILSANVHARNTAHQPLLDLVSLENPDLVTLQELNKSWLKSLKPLDMIYPYRQISREKYYEHLAIYSRMPIISTQEKYFGSYRIPALIVTLLVDGRLLTVYSTHLTSPTKPKDANARNEALALLAEEIRSSKEPVILIGDLNITPWSPFFEDFLAVSGLKDSRHGFGIQASWPAQAPPLWIPLDHCLVHPSIRVRDRRAGPDIGSDHFPLLINLSLPNQQENPGITATKSRGPDRQQPESL